MVIFIVAPRDLLKLIKTNRHWLRYPIMLEALLPRWTR